MIIDLFEIEIENLLPGLLSNKEVHMTDYSAKDIQVLPAIEAVRRRPTMYVGGDLTAQGLRRFILEVVKSAIDPESLNECTALHIGVHADDSLSITDNGRGQIVDLYPWTPTGQITVIETVMTTLFAGGPGQSIYQRFGYLFGFGAILNALSEWLTLETVTNGVQYRLKCARGYLTEPIRSVGPSNARGTRLRFKPDKSIWLETTLNMEALTHDLRQLNGDYQEVTITVYDEHTGVTTIMRNA